MRSVRLGSGLLMFAFVVCHFANHALGLHSLDAAEQGLRLHKATWGSPAGIALLSLALMAHAGIAFWQLYERRSLRLPRWQWAQIALGLAIPGLLMGHFATTILSAGDFGVTRSYVVIVHRYVIAQPSEGAAVMALMMIVWLHSIFGLHFWLRIRPWYPRARPYLQSVAVMLPVLALLGVWTSAREISVVMHTPALWDAMRAGLVFHPRDADAFITGVAGRAAAGVAGGIAAVALLRFARHRWSARAGSFLVTYDSGQKVSAHKGTTVLEASRLGGVPHASVCGGRGRCSTCRIRVYEPAACLTPASLEERRVLERVGAPANVRLACQARPTADVMVSPLVPTTLRAHQSLHPLQMMGQEMEIAILFADIRGFTNLSERKLPFDLVYILNRYCAAMGEAIELAGGQVDKFIGDGVMALFGVNSDASRGCRQAIHAARLMGARLTDLNSVLAHDLKEPLKIGIGIHVGPAIVGEMGYGRARSITAIGDAVNTASRLESMTKELACQLVISQQVARLAHLDVSGLKEHRAQVRGKEESITVYAVTHARDVTTASG